MQACPFGGGGEALHDAAASSSRDRAAINLVHLNSAVKNLLYPDNDTVKRALAAMSDEAKARQRILTLIEEEELGQDSSEESAMPERNLLDYVYQSIKPDRRGDFVRKMGEAQEFSEEVKKALRAIGGDYETFLRTLDSVFEANKSIRSLYSLHTETDFSIARKAIAVAKEGFTAGAHYCQKEEETGAGWPKIIMNFVTNRPSTGYFLLGSLKAVANRVYNCIVDFDVSITEEKELSYNFSYMLQNNVHKIDEEEPIEVLRTSEWPEDLPIPVGSFCEIFPWHMVLDDKLDIIQLGIGFGRLIGNHIDTFGVNVKTYFDFKSPPGVILDFYGIMKRSNSNFTLSLKEAFGQEVEVKGQMVLCAESNTLFYIGTPCADGLESLNSKGLFISDIPLHDATRDVILVGEQARAQDGLRRRLDKVKSYIEEASDAVSRERERNVQLLHLIFPPDIAERLWLGRSIEAKTYKSVTMLFSDIVGFTSICSTATPFMVCNMLERLYKQFDHLCNQFDVYKVETIGDAYCVAAGIQKPRDHNHAQRIAWMALSMIDVCPTHYDHEGKTIQMRIGIHTGTVLAGVVGVKMPRYCLFGHNVTLTNKFESGSQPLRINVSPTTHELLKDIEGFTFQARERKHLPKEFPPHIPGTCHFLLGYHHPGLDPSAPPKEHILRGSKSQGLGKPKPELKFNVAER
ncbi:head-specific guanylate cyclase isoform X2 [Halyomorpha halys]|uniref:head-specific guanylate cyclase isoform X2 n=1 Tax=Halyomorpha halys TaxID=286706 RepID=UPI0006D4E4BE